MALLISHRGNTNGINREKENSIEYIQEALNKEFFVMVDVFLIGDKHLALGCDSPQYPTTIDFLKNTSAFDVFDFRNVIHYPFRHCKIHYYI